MTERVDGDDQARPRGRAPATTPTRSHEAVDFLAWLLRGNFVLLGAREYDFCQDGRSARPRLRAWASCADEERSAFCEAGRRWLRRAAAERPPQRATSGDLLIVDKANALSPVHRRERMDYVGVRRVDADGEIVGEVAAARPVHDQGLRRAGVRDAAAAPQAAPVPRRPRT